MWYLDTRCYVPQFWIKKEVVYISQKQETKQGLIYESVNHRNEPQL